MAKNKKQDLPSGFLIAVSEILPEIPFGCNWCYISDNVMQWEQLHKALNDFAQNKALSKQYGFTLINVSGGCIVQIETSILKQYVPQLAREYRINIDESLLDCLDQNIQQLRTNEKKRLFQDLQVQLRGPNVVPNVRVAMGLCTRGGINQTIVINGIAQKVYKLQVQDLIVVLVQILRKMSNIHISVVDAKGVHDITGLLTTYVKRLATVTDTDSRQQLLNQYAQRLYNSGVSTFEGNALLYTIELNIGI